MQNFSRILIVVNPISGGIDKSSLLHQIKEELKKLHLEYSIYETSGENDREKLAERLWEYPPSRIFSIGGDGTIKLIAELMGEAPIPLAIFPAGSANGLAENLNLSENISELIKIALGHNFIDLDTIYVNKELCLHISDMGLNANLIKNYQEGNIRGKLGYFIQSIPTLIESDFPFSFTIEMDDKTIRRDAVLIAVANAQRYGTGATVNPKGKYDDGVFEILIFKNLNIKSIFQTFKEQVEFDPEFAETFQVKNAVIKTEKAIPFQIDGEYRGEVKKVSAKMSAVKLKITVP